ncbi:MAG: hypothetical protein FWB72_05090 [Firmicutes bacterium]|nr:hypothetical protein [Bacillota bacterium]
MSKDEMQFDAPPLDEPEKCPEWLAAKQSGSGIFVTWMPNKYKNLKPDPSNPRIMTPQQFLEEFKEESPKHAANNAELQKKMPEKPSFYYHYYFRALPEIVLGAYDRFEKFIYAGPDVLVKVMLDIADMVKKTRDFHNPNLPDKPFNFGIEKGDGKRPTIFIITPSDENHKDEAMLALYICIVLDKENPRYFVCEYLDLGKGASMVVREITKEKKFINYGNITSTQQFFDKVKSLIDG